METRHTNDDLNTFAKYLYGELGELAETLETGDDYIAIIRPLWATYSINLPTGQMRDVLAWADAHGLDAWIEITATADIVFHFEEKEV